MWRASLIDYLKDRLKLEGDILEVGTLAGDLTKGLAVTFPERKITTVDYCDPDGDTTVNARGIRMDDYYRGYLRGMDGEAQLQTLTELFKEYPNVNFVRKNSKDLKFSKKRKFAVIIQDGSKKSDIITHGLNLGWRKLKKGGYLCQHDYHGDIPSITETIDRWIVKRKITEDQIETLTGWWIIFEKR
jgi:hypothetical protein